MAVSTGNQQKSAPLATGTGNSREGSYVEVVVEVLTVSIFFDGTRNNRFNTEAGLKSEQQRKRDISYQNYYSNVALLHDGMARELGVHEKIYIEGAGTEKYQLDDKLGLAAAEGRTGLGNRVYEALTELQAKCQGKDIRTLHINVYGFSRGAAFARNFCYQLKNKKVARSPELAKLAKKANINLVGIFDTVSSVGVDHYNDVEPFGLDIGKAEGIARVLHLTAQNDYRHHFPLTSISGAIKDGIGFECSFPGAHSDIGGGYPAVFYERHFYLGLDDTTHPDYHENWIDYRFFKNKGYYTDAQLALKPTTRNPKIHTVHANRVITFAYQFVFADIMQSAISRFTPTKWLPSSFLKSHIAAMRATPKLGSYCKSAHQYVMANIKKNASLAYPQDAPREIYNQYIHNSLDYQNGAANKGSKGNKVKIGSKPVYIQAIRPEVTKGYR